MVLRSRISMAASTSRPTILGRLMDRTLPVALSASIVIVASLTARNAKG